MFDLLQPGLERMAETYGGILEGAFEETPAGRALQANVERRTADLRGRIRNLMARRGAAGQPLETGALRDVELGRGEALTRIPLELMGEAGEFFGRTLPGVTGITQPRVPQVQTGALQYLSQALPYNLGLQRDIGRYQFETGFGQGQFEGARRFPIAELFAGRG
jgi:hypothetical protein